MLCGVFVITGAASVCFSHFDCSQTVVSGDEVMNHHIAGCLKSMLCGGWSIGVSNLHLGICERHASRGYSMYCFVCLWVSRIYGFSVCSKFHLCVVTLHMPSPAHIGVHVRVNSVFCLCVGGFLLFQLCSIFVRRQLLRSPFVRRVSSFSREGIPKF
jgi:hypothetical protein